MQPWSVSASAGISYSCARFSRSPMRFAPSSSEYSLWVCRWTKDIYALSPRVKPLPSGPGRPAARREPFVRTA
jgi:hypothetical protein